MKKQLLLVSAFFLSLVPALSHAGSKILACETIDLVTERVIDRYEAVGCADPVYLVMNARELAGFVRDVRGADAAERSLEVELRYSSGLSYGISHGYGHYRCDGPAPSGILAEAVLEEPIWARPIALRCMLYDSIN